MIILTIRTDKPEAELGLYDDQQQLAYEVWYAHRALAETLHRKITDLLNGHHMQLHAIQGVVVYGGPGSFTGLRIGITVANALAYSFNVPIVASVEEKWLEAGIDKLLAGQADKIAIPEYGGEVFTTTPRK